MFRHLFLLKCVYDAEKDSNGAGSGDADAVQRPLPGPHWTAIASGTTGLCSQPGKGPLHPGYETGRGGL